MSNIIPSMAPLLLSENYDWQPSDLPSIEPLIITFFRQLSFISLFWSCFFSYFFLSWKTLEMSSPKTFFSHYVSTQVIPCRDLIQHKLWQKEQKLNSNDYYMLASYFILIKYAAHWKTLWCWARLKAGGEGDDRGWDGWMVSLNGWHWVGWHTQWTWVWASSSRCWRSGKPGMLQSMGSQRVRHNWATEQWKQKAAS